MSILKGLKSLLSSSKALMSLIILGVSTGVSLSGHMDPSFAAIVSVVGSIFMYTRHKTDIANLLSGQNNV